jgi:hypothetical protein
VLAGSDDAPHALLKFSSHAEGVQRWGADICCTTSARQSGYYACRCTGCRIPRFMHRLILLRPNRLGFWIQAYSTGYASGNFQVPSMISLRAGRAGPYSFSPT